MSHSSRFTDTGPTTHYYQGVSAGRDEVLLELKHLTDRFNMGESSANMVMYLYRFIEDRFADDEILDMQKTDKE